MTNILDGFDELSSQLEDERAQRLRATRLSTGDLTPERAARANALSDQQGQPFGVVAANLDEYDERAKLDRIAAAGTRTPAVGDFLADPRRMALAADEAEGLEQLAGSLGAAEPSWQQRLLGDIVQTGLGLYGNVSRFRRGQTTVEDVQATADVGRSVPAGAARGVGAAVGGFGELYNLGERTVQRGLDAVGLGYRFDREDVPIFLRPGDSLIGTGQQIKGVADVVGVPRERQDAATGIAEGVGQLGALAVQGIVAPQTIPATTFATGADELAGSVREAGAYGTGRGDVAIGTGAAVIGALERLGLEGVVNRLPPRIRDPFYRFLADSALSGLAEGGTEALQQVAQNAIIQQTVDSEQALGDGVLDSGVQGGGAAAIVRALLGLPGVPRSQTRRAAEDLGRILRSTDANARLRTQTDLAGELKLGEWSPNDLAAFVAQAGGDGQRVYLPAEQARVLFQSEALLQLVGSAEDVAEQLASGEVSIPLDRWMAAVPRLPNKDEILRHARTTPEGLSEAELEALDMDALAQEFGATDEAAERARPEGEADPRQRIVDDMTARLVSTDRYTPAAAESQARVWGAAFSRFGAMTGMDPMALYERYMAGVRGPDDPRAVRPFAGSGRLDALIESVRNPSETRDSEMFGPSLSSWAVGLGGLVDVGGDLRAADAHKLRPGLINRNGLQLDNAVERAIEDGFLPAGADINDLLDALNRDLRGDRVYSAAEGDTSRQDFAKERQMLLDAIEATPALRDMPAEQFRALTNQQIADALFGGSMMDQGEVGSFDNPLPESEMESAPVGAWVAGPALPGLDTRRQIMDVPLDRIDATEFDSAGQLAPEKRADAERYAEAMRAGEQFPNGRGSELPSGMIKLQDGHRRFAAARAVGAESMRLAVSPISLAQAANFDQPAERDAQQQFDESAFRPAVVSWAKGTFGDTIAPNGRPVWQNFVAWFGDSQAVDSAGAPLVVYHSTTFGNFDTFDKAQQRKGMAGYGFYFSDSDGANIYADYGMNFQAERDWQGNPKSVNIMPTYLRMENPLRADNIADVFKRFGRADPGDFGQGRKYGGMGDEAKTAIQRAGYDGVIAAEHVKRMRDGSYKVVEPGSKGAIAHPVYVVFEPNKIKSATANRGNFGGDQPGILEQPAYHGTPHDVDRFSLQKIGSGEGNQAFGWGIYFASNRDIADFYRRNLTGIARNVPATMADRALQDADGDRARAVASLTRKRDALPEDARGNTQAAIDWLRRGQNTGRLYEVDVPEDADLLAWDLPLSEQPEAVRRALAAEIDSLLREAGDGGEPTGADLYRRIAEESSGYAAIDSLDRAGLNDWYEEHVGYRPDDDNGSEIPLDDLRQQVREMRDELIRGASSGPERASKLLLARGIPGLRYLDGDSRGGAGGTHNYVIWDESAVSEPVRLFQDAAENAEAPVFYSAMLRAVEHGRGAPKRAEAGAWKGWLDGAQRRGEFKQAERDWLELDRWLDEQQGQVTREQLADFIRANEVQVEDVVLGRDVLPAGAETPLTVDQIEIIEDPEDSEFWVADSPAGNRLVGKKHYPTKEAAADFALRYFNGHINERNRERAAKAGVTPKYESYQLPGGENYRELLLTLPTSANTGGNLEVRQTSSGRWELVDTAEDALIDTFATEREALAERAAMLADPTGQPPSAQGAALGEGVFRSTHWNQPNVLVHVRFNERTDADGKRVLFIEEIQSDWHQDGRKRGYRAEDVKIRAATPQDWTAFEATGQQLMRFDTLFVVTDRDGDRFVGAHDMEDAQNQHVKRSAGVPDAPMKGTDEWAMLAFKRMVRYAVDNGFERIAWTTGEQQAARYDLSKQIDTIAYSKGSDGLVNMEVFKDGRNQFNRQGMSIDEVEATVGKEIAQKIAEGGGELNMRTGYTELSGLNLQVGGEGMRAFYDKILPSAVNKWGKRFGAKVGRTRLANETATSERNDDLALLAALDQDVGTATPTEGAEVVHAIDITPAMRDAAAQGMTLFQSGDAGVGIESNPNFRRWSNDATLIPADRAMEHEFKSGQKVVVEGFHGTKRPDRIGEQFRRARATSGPMAFFTSSPDIASKYATGKNDTSINLEENPFESWFKFKPKGKRSATDIISAWHYLTPEQKERVFDLAPKVRMDDQAENIILDDDNATGVGNYDYELQLTQRGYDRRGNPLKALVEGWLNGGTLYDQEGRFMEVLELAGFPVEDVTFDSPYAEFPSVYPVYLAMQSPLVTNDIPQDVVDALNAAAKRDRSRAKYDSGVDAWDKNTRTLREWVEQFNDDDSFVWTSIPDKVTKLLADMGYDGIIDVGGKQGGETHRVYIPFGDNQVKSQFNRGTYGDTKNIMRQGGQQAAPRGQIDIFPDRRMAISLFKGADRSTFLHETGHFFLEVFKDIAAMPEAPQQVKDDFAALLSWMGVGSADQIGVEQHEQFARGFERYLAEGRAPSPELVGVFAQFKAWLLGVYRNLLRLNVELTDDVRGVMDRMLASEEEIAAAHARVGYEPLPADVFEASAGAAGSQAFADYSDAVAAAVEEGKAEVLAKLVQAQDRATKAWWKEERAAVQEEVEAEYEAMPVYRAVRVLSGQQNFPDGTPIPEEMRIRLGKDALLSVYDKAYLRRLRGMYAKTGGVSQDDAAMVLGFASGDDLVKALANRGDMKARIEAETDARMLARHGDPFTDGRVAELAMEAIHGGRRHELLDRELQALARRAGQPAPLRRAIGAVAREMVGRKTPRQIRPAEYLAGERRAARESAAAAARGDYAAALQAKRQQAFNAAMYAESMRAQQEFDRQAAYLRRMSENRARARLGKAGQSYLDQVDQLLEQVEIRPVSGAEVRRRAALRDWVAEQEAAGNPVNVPERLLDAAGLTNLRDMPMQDIRAVSDAVRAIDHLAKTKNKLLLGRQERDAEAVDAEMAGSVLAAYETQPQRTGDTLRGEIIARKTQEFDLLRVLPTNIARELDGYEEGGPVWRHIIQPIRDAIYGGVIPEQKRMQDTLAATLRQHYSEAELRELDAPIWREAVGDMWSRGRILSLAMNWGSAGNREAILGQAQSRLSPEQVGALLSTLDARDFAVAQAIVDQINAYWPQIAESQRRRTGLVPEKVGPAPYPVVTSDGQRIEFRGGYYPLKYDADRSSIGTKLQEMDDAYKALSVGKTARAATRDGHTKERVGSGGKTVMLGLDIASSHMRDVIRDLHLGDAVNYVAKVMRGPQFSKAMADTGRREYSVALELWLKDVAAGEMGPRSIFQKGGAFIRQNLTAAVLTYKASTALLQVTGLFQTGVVLGRRQTVKGLGLLLSKSWIGPHSIWNDIREQSAFMAERFGAVPDAVMRVANARAGKLSAAHATMIRWGYVPMGRMQMIADAATWLAARDKALRENGGDAAAAVAYADDAVIRLQAPDNFIEKPAVSRGTLDESHRQSEMVKATSMLLSYMIAKGNIQREKFQRAGGNTGSFVRNLRGIAVSPRQAMGFGVAMMQLFLLETLFMDLLRNGLPDDDDDDGWVLDDWAAYIAGELALGTASTIPAVSQLATAGRGYDAQGPLEKAWSGAARSVTTLAANWSDDEDLGREDAKAIANLVGIGTGFPSSAANTAGDALWRLYDGEDVSPVDFVIRPAKPRDE